MLVETIGLTTLGCYTANRYKRKSLRQRLLTESSNSSKHKLTSKHNFTETTRIQRDNHRNLRISLASTGFTVAGGLFYTPLSLLSLPGIIYITYFSVANAYHSLIKNKKITIDILSGTTKILLTVNGYLFMAAVSVTIYSLNRHLLAKVSANSQNDLVDVFRQAPKQAWIVHEDIEREVAVETLKQDDIIVVSAGHAIPVDGYVLSGYAAIDQQLLTGESQPAEKKVGDEVFALTTVLSGRIYIKVTKAGVETTAAQIADILNATLHNKTEAQLWSRQITDKSVLPTLMLSGLSLPLLGSNTALAIMNSHFNYRAIICSTIGVMKYLNLASNKGILVKDGRTFEALGKVDTVVFDKTGTLTEEQPVVGRIYTHGDYTPETIIQLAAAAETRQDHPIAKAILQQAAEWELALPSIEYADYELGYGLSVCIAERTVRVGSLRFIQQHQINVPDELLELQQHCHADGSPVVMVAVDQQAVGAIELRATLRPGVPELMHTLREQGIQATYIISGDHEAPTRKLAQELGMEGYFAETLPEQKAKLIKQLQSEGKTVCYIGDGINDAIALQQADVSISLSGASSVATDAAQVILMNQNLDQLSFLLNISQSFDRHIKKIVTVVALPSVISAGSAIVFVSAGLTGSFVLPLAGLAGGLAVAMQPSMGKARTHSLSSSLRPKKALYHD